MSDASLPVTPGSGVNIDGRTVENGDFRQVIVIGDPAAGAAVAPVDPVKGLSVKVTEFPLDPLPVTIATLPAVAVSNFPVTQPVSVASLPAISVSNFPASQTVAGTVGISNFPAVQPISATSLPPVSVSNFPATQPVSIASLPAVAVSNFPVIQNVTLPALTGVVSVTGAAAAAVTATLPAVAGQFHYIAFIEIVKMFTAANVASATPLVVTTTNLPGSLAFTFGQLTGVIGVIDRIVQSLDNPLKSLVANTNSTIVCPATAGIIWRVNVYYFTGV